LSFLLAEAGRGELTPDEAEKLGRLVSEHHKAVQLTEIEERLRGLEEALPKVPPSEPKRAARGTRSRCAMTRLHR
jgi:aminoglycoside phosphotransferase family enzyme